MEDKRYNLLSRMGKDFVKREKKEFSNFDLIKELSLDQARKFGNYSGALVSNLEIYLNEKSSSEDKVAALEAVKSNYTKVVDFARKYKTCFEARKVLLMCEAKMISAKLNPAKLNEEIEEVKTNNEDKEG